MGKRLNLLLITSDQQRWDTLGINNPRIHTPNLDRLARQGTSFTRAYCNNPVCSPSRSTIITGLYPSMHHCWTIGVKLPKDVPTLGDALRGAGHESSLIGKAHFQPLASQPGSESIECHPVLRDLNFWRGFHGPWYGFDHIELARNHGDENLVGQHYALWMEQRGLKNWKEYFQPLPDESSAHAPRLAKGRAGDFGARESGSWSLPAELHYTTWTAERSISRIEHAVAEDKPFFLWASFHDPHPPYIVPEPWASMYRPEDMIPGQFTPGEFEKMPPHFAMTRDPNAGWSVYEEPGGHWRHGFHCHLHDDAELRKAMAIYYGMISFMDQQIGRILDRLDELGLADNTLVVFTTDHGHFLCQHGLVTKGAFHYEDLIRLPFIVRCPGRVSAGGVNADLQSLVDLAPTFLSAAGAPVPGLMQGINQLDAWCGRAPSPRDHVIVENRHQPTKVHLRTFITDRYKLTVYRGQSYGELFDLSDDPGELRNRWDDPALASVKADLFQRFIDAEIRREPMRMPRIAGA